MVNVGKVISDAVNKITESSKPKRYIVFYYRSYSPMDGSLYTIQYVTEKELKQFIEKHHTKDMYIFELKDAIKYNIDVTIEDINDQEEYDDFYY